ncbi:hypothetical protein [Geobacter argillaceus]|uniref:hypothetical protein n=1 Tax=Geobacter argillaceus TaxID=345631 RepID=UPI0011A198D3|nr:hypothetical protein [Geobacter argillaceus]
MWNKTGTPAFADLEAGVFCFEKLEYPLFLGIDFFNSIFVPTLLFAAIKPFTGHGVDGILRR